jgi:hypothetical protein
MDKLIFMAGHCLLLRVHQPVTVLCLQDFTKGSFTSTTLFSVKPLLQNVLAIGVNIC